MKAGPDTPFAKPVFAGLAPPTLSCFLAQVRMRYYAAMHSLIHSDAEDMEFWHGMALGMVYVLYDVNTMDAHTKLQRIGKVKGLLLKRQEKECDEKGQHCSG